MSETWLAREWNSSSYDRVGAPLTGRGQAVLERLDLAPDAAVLDAGCGTGRVTSALLELLPEGRVIALDGSRSMLEAARAHLGPDPRVRFLEADLTKPLTLDEPLDAVVSTSALHWVPDHPQLLGRLGACLRPGGALHVDCGGEGNIASITTILADLGEPDPWTFSGVAETEGSLEAAGFSRSRVWLSPDPVDLTPGAELEEYLATVVLGTHLEGRSRDERREFVREVAGRLDRPRIDYVRLNIDAWLG